MPETGRIQVTEPDIYSPDSPHSFFRDVFANATNTRSAGARERLSKYGAQLASEGDSREQRNARAVWRDAFRHETGTGRPEQRAMTSGSASAGALVTPLYLTDQYAPWNEYVPSFALACTSIPLDDYGMQINIPAVTGGVTAPVQSAENTAQEADATAQYRSANLLTFFGTGDISQQEYDRTGPTGFDLVVYNQLRASMDQQIDVACISAVVAAVPVGNQLTRAALPSSGVTGATWTDINKAASLLETPNGTSLPATHAFMSHTRYRYTAAQLDNQNRPVWQPDGMLPPDWSHGITGYKIASTALVQNGSIPTVGTAPNDQIVVANPASTILAKGTPYLSALVDTSGKSTQLTVALRLYNYAAPIVRYPKAAATITGAAYPTSVTWI